MAMRTLDIVLGELSIPQRQFVITRMGTRTDQDAAKIVGVHPKTVCHWKDAGVPIDEALDLLSRDMVAAASAVLREGAVKAASILVEELEQRGKDRVRAAVEILNRIGLPETKRVEGDITGLGVLVVLDEPPEDQV